MGDSCNCLSFLEVALKLRREWKVSLSKVVTFYPPFEPLALSVQKVKRGGKQERRTKRPAKGQSNRRSFPGKAPPYCMNLVLCSRSVCTSEIMTHSSQE